MSPIGAPDSRLTNSVNYKATRNPLLKAVITCVITHGKVNKYRILRKYHDKILVPYAMPDLFLYFINQCCVTGAFNHQSQSQCQNLFILLCIQLKT